MSAGKIGGAGLGTTAVLGVRIVRGAGQRLATTGLEGMRLIALAAAGFASLAAGLVLRGRGRKVVAGRPLE